MATIINMHKAVRRIKLDDTPESPEFTLDLTDDGMQRKAVAMAGACAVYRKLVQDCESNGITDSIKERMAAIYHVIVDVMLGDGAFDKIMLWTAGGTDVPAHEVTMAFAPLIAYLVDEYDMVLTANKSEAVARYLDGVEDADAL